MDMWKDPVFHFVSWWTMGFIMFGAITALKKTLLFFQNEIFASRHQDVNSVACIEDKCYVLTLAQYCR